MIKLSVIIPVYNEIKTIEKLISRVFEINISKQIIIVADTSEEFLATMILNNNKDD